MTTHGSHFPGGSVQVLVLDSYPLTRLGLGVLLHSQNWVARCLLATDRNKAITLAERHRPDLAVVEISAIDGPFVSSYLAPLRAARSSMPIVLSSYYGPIDGRRLLGFRGAGLLTAETSIAGVLDTVRAALAGEERPAPVVTGSRPIGELSEREREVLALLCTGATNREIAALMQVGPETVKKHAGALYRKLGVRNRTEAAQWAQTLVAA